MFDGIIYNMLTDACRAGMIAAATYLGLTGTTEKDFVAGGLAVLAGFWAWYENRGHQEIVNALKKSTDRPTIPSAMSAVRGILLPFAVTFFLLSLAMPGFAQTATKAPAATASPTCSPPECTGFFLSGGIGGVGANIDIIGQGLDNSLFAGGAIPTIGGGYIYWNGSTLFMADAGIGDQFSTSATANGVSGNENGFFSYEGFRVGGDLQSLLNITNAATEPSALASHLISPYAGMWAVQREFQNTGNINGWMTGAGFLFDISSNIFADIGYRYINYGAVTNGDAQFGDENLVFLSVNYIFK